MSQFFLYYTEANLVCFIIFGILLVHDILSLDRQEKQLRYDEALVAFMLYFAADSFWAAIVSGVLPASRFAVVLDTFAIYLLMAFMTYGWLRYVMAVEQVPHRNRPVNRFAVVFPFLVSTIILVITYCVAPQVLINESNEVLPAFNWFLVTVPYIYIGAVLIYTMRRAKDEENPIEKRKHLYIGFFPLMVVAGGLVQMLAVPYTPVFCFSCTVLMLIFYIQAMDRQISVDPLTTLNNRGQLMRYISQKSNLYMEERKTFVIMMDVNGFKSINDIYGHAEGDKALILIADALKQVIKGCSMPVFLGRYGGDEFILIVHPASEGELTPLIGEIRAQIESHCRTNETPYLLSVGIGYDVLLEEQDTIQKCIQRADKKLYQDKAASKSRGQTTVCS